MQVYLICMRTCQGKNKQSGMEGQYFERQDKISLLCGLHSVNNILGSHRYSKDDLNEICYSLSDDLINPHKHIFGGDYDVNVLIIALQREKCVTRWHDGRVKDFKIKEEWEGRNLVGYLVNKYQDESILHKILRISPRHWIAVRKVNERFHFMDSKEELNEFSRADAQKKLNQLLNEYDDQERRTEIIEVYQQKQQTQEQLQQQQQQQQQQQ